MGGVAPAAPPFFAYPAGPTAARASVRSFSPKGFATTTASLIRSRTCQAVPVMKTSSIQVRILP